MTLSFLNVLVICIVQILSRPFNRVAVTMHWGNYTKDLFNTLQDFNLKLDSTWTFQVFYSQTSHRRLSKFASTWPTDRIRFSYIGHNISFQTRNSFSSFLVLNESFWESVSGKKILMFQTDSAICSKSPYSINQYLQYDYIGAPFPRYWLYNEYGELIPSNDNEFHGGNGGFSIRSRKSMIECSKGARDGTIYYAENWPEDIFFSSCVKYFLKHQILPNRTVSASFSTETVLLNNQSFGYHKASKHLSEEDVRIFKESCPEILSNRAFYNIYLND